MSPETMTAGLKETRREAAKTSTAGFIDNISSDYKKIVDFKKLIEKLELYPIHLPDVVEDFLS